MFEKFQGGQILRFIWTAISPFVTILLRRHRGKAGLCARLLEWLGGSATLISGDWRGGFRVKSVLRFSFGA